MHWRKDPSSWENAFLGCSSQTDQWLHFSNEETNIQKQGSPGIPWAQDSGLPQAIRWVVVTDESQELFPGCIQTQTRRKRWCPQWPEAWSLEAGRSSPHAGAIFFQKWTWVSQGSSQSISLLVYKAGIIIASLFKDCRESKMTFLSL